jgi:Ternary complex associated domain 9
MVPGADSIEMEPYGVIRIVRDERATFSSADRNLADLLAQGLSRWIAKFPVNYDLKIIWFPDDGSKQQEEKKRSLLTKLFGISPMEGPRFEQLQPRIENEFAHLLKKIFVNCNEITISRVFSGGSGASVLLVQNDYGQDLILKCCRVQRGPTRPHGSDHRSSHQKHGTPAIFQSGNDPISDEIKNYRKFVEGRLPLTHNVIYPDLIRETWLLKGFATNLVGTPTGARKSLTEYCGTVANSLVDLAEAEDHISHVVGTFLARIWAWWYQHEKSKHHFEARLDDFLTNHLVESDGGMFWLVKGGKAGMEEFDNKYHREISKILDSRVEKCPSPGTIWQTVINQAGSRQVQSGLAVVHGDAHGDNIFFDTQSRDVWVIDFARTGRRVNIFDFAFLEADLKFRHLPNLIGKGQKVDDSPEFLMAFNEFEQALASQTTYEKLCIPPQHKAYGQLRVLGKIILDIRRLAAQQLERRGTFLDYQALSFLMAYKHIDWAETEQQKVLAYLSLRSIAGSLCAPTANNEISGGGTDGGAALPLRRRTAAAARKRKKTHG